MRWGRGVPRYLLIDNRSGHLLADVQARSPEDACQSLKPRWYSETWRFERVPRPLWENEFPVRQVK
jgi:hypothetical protein